MSCLDDDQLFDFAAGVLTDEDMRRFDQHVKECADCRSLVGEVAKAVFSPADEAAAPDTIAAKGVLAPGIYVGRYEVRRLIGAGGMGVVYAAYDAGLRRMVALKLMRADMPEARLLAEARAMARLSHPNVVGVYDVGVYEGRVFLAMEYVDGVPFDRWLGDREHPWTETLDVVIAAAHGLDAAHQRGVVHGDLTPSNILVGRDGRVRVTDFGLARSLPRALDERTLLHAAADRADSSAPTRIGDEPAPVAGTVRYLAPEQLRGRRSNERSDQFAFAVVLYEALYRVHPFAASEPAAFVTRVRLGTLEPPPPGSGVPSFIFRALARALSVNPDERYPTIEALVDTLNLHEPTTRTLPDRGWLGLAARALALMGIGFTVGGTAAALRARLGHAPAPARAAAITTRAK